MRKHEKSMQKGKYILAVISFALVIMTIKLGITLISFYENILSDPESLEIYTFMFPTFLIGFFMSCAASTYFTGLTIMNWNGNRERRLLIGIADKLTASDTEQATESQHD